MLLLIDTSKVNSIVALGNKQGEIIDIRKNITKLKLSQMLLSEISLLLRRNRVSFEDLKGIIVVQGPGGFTGLRVGISVANSLGYGLETPVVGVKKCKVQNVKCKIKSPKLKISYKSILEKGLKELGYVKLGKIVRPFYGEEPHVTVKE